MRIQHRNIQFWAISFIQIYGSLAYDLGLYQTNTCITYLNMYIFFDSQAFIIVFLLRSLAFLQIVLLVICQTKHKPINNSLTGLNNTILYKGNMVGYSLIKKIEFVGLYSYVAEASEQTNFMCFFWNCALSYNYTI